MEQTEHSLFSSLANSNTSRCSWTIPCTEREGEREGREREEREGREGGRREHIRSPTVILTVYMYMCIGQHVIYTHFSHTNLLLEALSQSLLQASHGGHVLTGGGQETQLQLLWLGHHLAKELVVGEDWGPREGAVVLDALSPHRKLQRERGGGGGRGRGREGGEGGRGRDVVEGLVKENSNYHLMCVKTASIHI